MYALIALAKYLEPLRKDNKIDCEGHNKKIGSEVGFTSTGADVYFNNWITLGYARRSGHFIRITEKGKKMAEFLDKQGFILDMLNGQILTQGYIPFSKRSENKK